MRKQMIAGNWKMNKTICETSGFLDKYSFRFDSDEKEVVIFPPFTSFFIASEKIKTTQIKLGAQNMHYEDAGAFTGEISAPMLNECGCEYVLVAHSERRKYFNETNKTASLKIKAAYNHKLKPILCVGEDLIQRERNETFDVIARQLKEGLEGVLIDGSFVIAYEPVWAIGTGRNATDAQAEQACAFIREEAEKMYGGVSEKIRILYGGSVSISNIKSLMAMENIDGVLVGGASLTEDFAGIVNYDKI